MAEDQTEASALGESLQVEGNVKAIPDSDIDAKEISKHVEENVEEEAVKSKIEELEDKGAVGMLEVHVEVSEVNVKACPSKRKAKTEARGSVGAKAKKEPCVSATNESSGGEDSNGKKNPCESGVTGISGVDDWLPEGWVTEVRTRQVGGSAGSKDKYYRHPMVARCFRSRTEVMTYIESGKFPLKRRKCTKDASSVEKSKKKPERKKSTSKNLNGNSDPTQALIEPSTISAGSEELSASLGKTTNQAAEILLPEIPSSSSGATQDPPALTLSKTPAFNGVTQSPTTLALPEIPSPFSGVIQNPLPLGVSSMEWQNPHRRAKLPVVSRKASKLVVDSTRPVAEDGASLGLLNGKALLDSTISSESQMIKPAPLDNPANENSRIDNVKEEVICNSVQQVWLGLFFTDEQVAGDIDGNQKCNESNELGLKADDFDIKVKDGEESRYTSGGFLVESTLPQKQF